eukprot:GHVR01135579.1.p1 GENE.GHVR01135579.1~~GHVR01135579.1.p1  ORF type:complete len:222 (+),score=22.69 GHVR01135579.1:100-765(+)
MASTRIVLAVLGIFILLCLTVATGREIRSQEERQEPNVSDRNAMLRRENEGDAQPASPEDTDPDANASQEKKTIDDRGNEIQRGARYIVTGNGCNDGFERDSRSQTCYKLEKSQKNWYEAYAYCIVKYQARLATVTDIQEQYFLAHLAKGYSSVWIDVNAIVNGYEWRTGNDQHLISFSWWARFQPSSKGERCVEMRSYEGYRWNDLPCDRRHYFFCKYNH